MEQTYDVDSEPIVCINCDTRFNTDLEHNLHNHENHHGFNA
jgi:NDP-sugar pyrophosphorylase family protein